MTNRGAQVGRECDALKEPLRDALKEPLRERIIPLSTGMRCSERAATRTHNSPFNW
ncbi:MAG: hypothetical protein F6K49_51450, partial [Moorea sp. SIO3I6]|nr:hypothetical protein [Moorena sp. SIO3I6]